MRCIVGGVFVWLMVEELDCWKDCCRFSDWISGELQEDLPYRLPFTLNIGEVCLYVSLEGGGG